MLKIQLKDQPDPPIWVMEKTFSIGQAEKNNLTLKDPTVASQHARILNQGDHFLLKDLGSEHGTYVNDKRVNQKYIACGDIIRVGSIEIMVVDPFEEVEDGVYWSLIADSSWLSGQEFPIVGELDQVFTVGRSSQCNIVLPSTHLSRVHAEITIKESKLAIKDMDSANGTFVNEKRINSAELRPGDRLRLDVYSFRVFGPGIKLPTDSTTTDMKAVNVAVDPSPTNREKKWKSKPTSPGNREEINLYKKHYKPFFVAGIIVLAVVGVAVYVAMAFMNML